MSLIDRLLGREKEEKLNPAQPHYVDKVSSSKEPTFRYQKYYETIEVVNRGVNMVVDDASEILSTVGVAYDRGGVFRGTRAKTLQTLITQTPNPFQDISTFRRNLITDFIMDGNIFIYYDGVHMYHLPADKMIIHSSEKTYVKKYTFNEVVDYSPEEIIHIKENSFDSIYRGVPRLKPALNTMKLVSAMKAFQQNFFDNGAVPGLVIKSPNTLSTKIKDRLIESWIMRYSPTSGGRRPMILDGGLSVESLTDTNFRDLDFQVSIEDNEKIILKALGVPPLLLDSGNNANLRPNMKMYYLETILPIVRKIDKGLSRYFGFIIAEDITDVTALQAELAEQSDYYSSLVNGGIITPNEARHMLGYCDLEGCEEIRIPQNVAGSAVDPSVGGRPPQADDDE